MTGLVLLARAGVAGEEPPDGIPTEPWEASPGIEGFLFFFAMALVVILLARSMLRHVRRVEHRRPPEDGSSQGQGSSQGDDSSQEEGSPRPAATPEEPQARD